jgi:predicted histone-like DNA-binding protein
MAQRKIAFPIVYKQNQNEQSAAYGKYYPEAYPPETLSLRGLIERVAFDQSVYSRDIVEGVIQKLTRVMVELLTGGQPVKWDGLGTFTPKIESVKGGVTEAQLKAGSVNVRDAIEGVHIRFIPENEKGEELTSRRMKDAITFSVEGVKILTKVGVAPNQKTLVSIESLEKFANSESSGGGSSAGSETAGQGSESGQGGNSGSQGGQNQGGSSTGSDTAEGCALTISTSGSGSASVTKDGNAVTSGSNLNEDDEVEISITPAEGETPTATINGSSIELTESEGVYSGNFAMPGQASTLVINTGGSSGGNGGADLDKD